ncbi:MAG: ATP-dependent DNA helicase [bacterium JZ-2024 1]
MSDLQIRVSEAFSAGGIIGSRYPGYERREDQVRMALNVTDALEAGTPVLIEAGTGIGKSLAYLVPSIYWATAHNKRVIVSTYTKALQDQLFAKDLPMLQKVMDSEFSFSCMYGAENYVSLRRLHRAYAEARSGLFSLGTTVGLEALVDWANQTKTGLRMELEDAPPPEAWAEARRDPDDCMGKDCPYFRTCFYFRARRQARESHILVVNHALLFASLASDWWVFPRPDALVLDEAHTIEDVISESLGMRITRHGATRLMTEIGGGPRGPGIVARLKNADPLTLENIRAISSDLREALERFFGDVQRALPDKAQNAYRLSLPVATFPPGLLWSLKNLSAYLKEAEREAVVAGDVQEALRIRSYVKRVEGLASAFNELSGKGASMTVYWVERGNATNGALPLAIRSAPLEVGPFLQQKLFVEGFPVVMTSATLTVAGSFVHFRRRCGLEGVGIQFRYPSPFDYARQSLLWMPPAMPDPHHEPEAYNDAVTREILDILGVTSGATMVLCTSYATVERVSEVVRETRPDLTVLSQCDTEAGTLLRLFRKKQNAVLIGTASFWQGVDLPGEVLICVVVTRLPFEVPDNPVVEARREWIERNGGNAFLEYSLPHAVLMFRQGFGRLIRTRSDWGIVAVLDPRLNTRRYGRMFIDSLPPMPKTTDLREVAAFIAKNTGARI